MFRPQCRKLRRKKRPGARLFVGKKRARTMRLSSRRAANSGVSRWTPRAKCLTSMMSRRKRVRRTRSTSRRANEVSLIAAVMMLAGIFPASAAAPDGAKIDQLTGLEGKLNEKEGVYRVTFPRADVKVAVDGWTMPPFMGLGTWAAFMKGSRTEAIVMGIPFFLKTRQIP